MKIRNEEYIQIKEYLQILEEELGMIQSLQVRKSMFEQFYKDGIYKNDIIVLNDNIYINRQWIQEILELFKKSIMVNQATIHIQTLINSDDYATIRRALRKKCNIYKIPILNAKNDYILKSELDKIIKSIKEVQLYECITSNELMDIVNSMFIGIKYTKKEKKIFKYVKDNKLLVIKPSHYGNFTYNALDLYPKKTVDLIINNLIEDVKLRKVKLINLTYEEYFKMCTEDLSKNYKILTLEECIEICGIESHLNPRFKNFERTFKTTDVKCIWIHTVGAYVSKKEFEKFLRFKKEYLKIQYINDMNGINVTSSTKFYKMNDINVVKYKDSNYIHIKDVDKYVELRKFNEFFIDTDNIYDRFMFKYEHNQNINKEKYTHLNSIYFKFVRQLNKTNKCMIIATNAYKVYELFLMHMNKDICHMNIDEVNELFAKLVLVIGQVTTKRNMLIQFSNYLISKENYNIAKIINNTDKKSKERYNADEFINLLIKLIDILADENKLKLLYRNWNLSTAITYIFVHYTLAWRKMDFIKQLPTPNLKDICGSDDGEEFIKWLEKGNKISDKQAFKVCENLENITKRLNLKANKNNQRLSCIVSSSLAKEVVTLLCISEANKQIHIEKFKAKRKYQQLFNAAYTEPKKITNIIKESFGWNIAEILSENFENVKMNKSFLQLVKDKAEELGLAYSYYYAQVARGHKPTKKELSETTKIYLDKEISSASLRAFTTGTMGSVLHLIMNLIDNKYEEIEPMKQIEIIKEMNITPYTIENNLKKIIDKISIMKDEVREYFQGGIKRDEFLKQVLFSQNCYGVDKQTKCLLKITRKDSFGIIRIESKGSNNTHKNFTGCPLKKNGCIGCDYMIALRYFIYEFASEFNKVLTDLEECKEKLDREICIDSINEIFIPVLNDLGLVLGEEISNMIDIKRYLKLVESM